MNREVMNEEEYHNNQRGFNVPDDYFRRSAHAILNKIEWEEELSHYPALRKRAAHGFTVPGGFFVKNECKLELLPFPGLCLRNKDTGFRTPGNYFDSLSARFSDGNEKMAAAGWYSNRPSREVPFGVPEGYFTGNANKLRTRLTGARRGQIIPIKRWMYAAAAMLTLLAGGWLFNYYNAPAQSLKDCGTIACIDKLDIIRSQNIDNFDGEELYDVIDADKLERNLDLGGGQNEQSDSGAKSKRRLPGEI
jgi:hypothetical protein